jgi:hypothetical protein
LPALFPLDRQATRPDVDVDALWLLVILIELVAQHGDSDRKRAENEIKYVVAGHGRFPLDAIAFALTA